MKPLPEEDLDHILEHTSGLWEELRGERVFITGGTGFFGCWLTESFCHANRALNLGARATILTRDRQGFACKVPHLAASPYLEFLDGDVRTFALPQHRFGYVIHAATTSAFFIDPRENFEIILSGTQRVLDAAIQCGARRLLYVSSGAVYGVQPPDMSHVPESYAGAPDPLAAASTYGEGKRAAEHLCALYQSKGLETTVARCFAFVGPHLPLDQHFAVGNFIRDTLAGRPIVVKGDGTAFRSYLYAADLAIWLWTILLKGTSARAYNVGSDEAISIGDLARKMKGPAVEILGQPTGAPPTRYVPDISRAREELRLAPCIGLDDAIRRTSAWYAR